MANNLTGIDETWRSSLTVGSGPGGGAMQQRSVGNVYDAGRRLIKEIEITATGPSNSKTVTSEYFYDGDNNRTRKNVTVTEGSVTKTVSTLFEYGNGVSADNYDPRFNSNQMASYREYNGTTLSPASLRREVFYTYDGNGNRTRAATRQPNGTNIVEQYQWDPQDRLVGYRRSNNMTGELMAATYGYDYRCRRVYRSEQTKGGSADNAFVVFSGGTSVREHAAPVPLSVSGQSTYVFSATALPAPHPPALGTLSAPVVETIRGSDLGGGIGGILYTHRPGNASGDRARFNSYNSRGDVVTQSNETGAITWAATYEAFGKRTQEKGLNKDRQRANTKEEDYQTGLLNEGFRYRDLATGEFISRDPAGFMDGPNVYTYVRQNPWTAFDAKGLAAIAAYDGLRTTGDMNPVIQRSGEYADEYYELASHVISLGNDIRYEQDIVGRMRINAQLSRQYAEFAQSAINSYRENTLQILPDLPDPALYPADLIMTHQEKREIEKFGRQLTGYESYRRVFDGGGGDWTDGVTILGSFGAGLGCLPKFSSAGTQVAGEGAILAKAAAKTPLPAGPATWTGNTGGAGLGYTVDFAKIESLQAATSTRIIGQTKAAAYTTEGDLVEAFSATGPKGSNLFHAETYLRAQIPDSQFHMLSTTNNFCPNGCSAWVGSKQPLYVPHGSNIQGYRFAIFPDTATFTK